VIETIPTANEKTSINIIAKSHKRGRRFKGNFPCVPASR